MPDIIAHAFKDVHYFSNIAADLPTARKRNPEQPGSSQPTHIVIAIRLVLIAPAVPDCAPQQKTIRMI
jgi:hypothetical protein